MKKLFHNRVTNRLQNALLEHESVELQNSSLTSLSVLAAAICMSIVGLSRADAENPSPSSGTSATSTLGTDSPQSQEGEKGSSGYLPAPPLAEFSIDALEPRYVAPTRRDRIGRIWAPVLIGDKGPFRLVLDTAATRSGVTESVARALGIPLDQSPQLMLRGVTGSAAVPSIRVASLSVGDLMLRPVTLPIVTDALGGAEGVLGTEGLGDMRIYIDFQRDFIGITHSRRQRAGADFKVIPMLPSSLGLIVVDMSVGKIRAKGIIATASQVTVGNSAMLDAVRRGQRGGGRSEQIEGITTDVQSGQAFDVPTIFLGTLGIQGARAILGDMHIFETWKMTKEPVLLIGMDTIGQLDTIVIDYRLRELQLRMRVRDRRTAFPNP